MAKAKRALPRWASPNFLQPTKSTRTHLQRKPTTVKKSPFKIQVTTQSSSGAKTYSKNKK